MDGGFKDRGVLNRGLVYGRGISFPPRLGPDGRVAWSSGPDNIREAIRVILMTEPGERVALPEFGSRLKRLLFEPNTVATRRLMQATIEQALARWEPRITVKQITVEPAADDPRAALATIVYRLIADQSADRVSLRLTTAAPG